MPHITQKQVFSIFLTFIVYCLLVPWQAALLLVVAVGFHESSHLWAAHKMGLQTKGFYLVPFMGGVAFINGPYRTLGQQAFVVLAGPFGGGLLAAVTAGAWYVSTLLAPPGMPFLAAAAAWMAVLNLFNLLPFSFMDGGQLLGTITYSINRTLGFICYAISTVVAVAALMYLAPVLGVLVVLFGGPSLWREYNNWNGFRKGQLYLCTDEYLNPPKKLSVGQMSLTIGGWLLTGGLLLLLLSQLAHSPAANFSTLFRR